MKLLVDAMCGDLVPYLRLCNHDTTYALDRGIEADEQLCTLASNEDRTLITRDRTLGQQVDDSIVLDSTDTDDQLRALEAAGVDLTPGSTPEYCGRCNGSLSTVPATVSTPEYAPQPNAHDLWQCKDCEQYFWKGSHWQRMTSRLAGLSKK